MIISLNQRFLWGFLQIVENIIIRLISDNEGSVIARCLCSLFVVCLFVCFKVIVDLQSAFWKMLCLRAALKKTMVNYISLES